MTEAGSPEAAADPSAPRFELTAARPALDLCNTAGGEGGERLVGVDDLAAWCVAAGLAEAPPRVEADDLAQARALRDQLRPALVAEDDRRVIALAEQWLSRAPVRLCVEPATLQPLVAPREATVACGLVAVALDALALMRDHPGRVRQCAGPACGMLFLDTTRNHSRRWCSMERCGSRAKASAYYRRQRGAATAG